MASVPKRQELLPPSHGYWGNYGQEDRTSEAVSYYATPYIPPEWSLTEEQLHQPRPPSALPQVMTFRPVDGYETNQMGLEDVFQMSSRTQTQAERITDYSGVAGRTEGSPHNYTTFESSGWG